jgi:ankyrin repeat protein
MQDLLDRDSAPPEPPLCIMNSDNAGLGPKSSAIHDAARAGDLPEVKALLQNRPDLVFSKERAGGTPLHCAAQIGHNDVAQLLRQHPPPSRAKP